MLNGSIGFMKRYLLFWFVFALSGFQVAAKVALDPTITPSLFQHDDQITVSYEVTGTSLANLSNAFIWVWIPGSNIDAKYNVNPASSDPTKTNNAKFTKTVADGKTIFTITFTPSDFFAQDISGQTSIGMLLKGNDWNNGNDQTTDYVVNFWDGTFQVNLVSPAQNPLFVDTNDPLLIKAETSVTADFDLFIDGVLITEQNGVTLFSYTHTVTETSGDVEVEIVASTDTDESATSFIYLISAPSPVDVRPAGIVPGINYGPDPTKVTLCLWAPDKSSAYVQGDFTGWEIQSGYLMNRDGEYFWLEIGGLTSGLEYAFRYLVDETIYVADPFADKILDPDDQYIPTSVYPALKQFPQEILDANWYNNRVSVLQTNQTPYNWQVTDFVKPEKESLIVHEVLIRDFFGNGERSYENLIDTLSYFKRLGVNAIQLMPIMEFNGNEGWGYNPTFMLAPDKYYGIKNKLKEFIDRCHQEGIAVILDIAMNHQDLPNPFVLLDFDFAAGKPRPTNKWFNPEAKHPFNVFFDLNHESAYTQAYLDSITHYWIHEYKVDGYRFDLSKGFTQKFNTDVGAWSAYDATRIAILKRMADKIWAHTPDAYIILEHFAQNSEEKELAEYRAAEGKGMMLWGNHNWSYAQNTMGYTTETDVSGIYHGNRTWTVPHLVGYMESHDEERVMYKNITFGNTLGSYSTKDITTALARMRAAFLYFLPVPGPKMIWQFGEMGFDQSINRCEDGSISDNCRLSPKPVPWAHQNDSRREALYNLVSDLARLKKTYEVFQTGQATFIDQNTLKKQLTIKSNPYTATPASADQMNVQIVSNFSLQDEQISVAFPHTGVWYDYYAKQQVVVNTTPFVVDVKAGGYRLYTDYPINNELVTSVSPELGGLLLVFPNPASEQLIVHPRSGEVTAVRVHSLAGQTRQLQRLVNDAWDVSDLPAGLVILDVQTTSGNFRSKILIRR